MKLDLLDLLRQDTAVQARVESYGIDPVRLETWLQDQRKAYSDPTADIAVANADRALARRRKANR